MINWQLSKQGIRWPVSPDHSAGSSVNPSRSSIFWSYPLTNYQFQMIQGFISNMLCFCHYGPALLGFWFQTGLGSENLTSFFKSTGGEEDLILPWSRVGHTLRLIFVLWLVKIWQVSSCGQIMQHLESCLLWQLKLTEFCVNLWCFELPFSSGCTKGNTVAIKSLLLVCFLGFCLRNASLVKIR